MFLDGYPTTVFNGTDVPNLTIRVEIINKIKNNISLFSYRIVKDGQRPEDVALDVYNDVGLYWVILLMNDVVDPFYDWILSDDQLMKFIQTKYGVDKVYSVHHYETTAQSELGPGVWVNLGTPFATPVSNYAYEYELNEEKRKIKILNPFYIPQVVAEYEKEIRNARK